MSSVTGSQLAFFANGNSTGSNINLVLTPDGTGTLTPVAGQFNIEVFTASVGSPSLATGFQASAFIQGAVTVSGNSVQAGTIGSTEQLLDGSFQLVNTTPGEKIEIIGNGGGGSNDTVVGASSDTIIGSTNAGNVQLINGGAGIESIVGGAGSTNVIGGAFDTITGAGGGPLTVVGAASGHLSITGGAGGLTAFDLGKKSVVDGAGVLGAATNVFIDDSYAGGGQSTLIGGVGAINFVKGGVGDSISGGKGAGTTSTVLDGHLGSQTVVGGVGATTFIIASSDRVFGGSASTVFIESRGADTITGGTLSPFTGTNFTDVYVTGAKDSIIGASGNLQVGAAVAETITVLGGTGNLNVFNLGAGSSVVGASAGTTFINDAYGKGGSSMLVGGGSATTIVAGANDSIVGKAGAMEIKLRTDISAGAEDITLGGGADGIRDISVAGGTGAHATVTGFNTSTDRIESAQDFVGGKFIGTSGSDGSGGTLLTFTDGTTLDLLLVADPTKITFTS